MVYLPYIQKIAQKGYISQFVPQSLKEFLEKNGDIVIYKNTKLKTLYFVDIIHHFILKYYFFHVKDLNLSSIILKNKYGAHYNYYFEYLQDLGYLELVSNYFSGKKCKTWTLAPKIYEESIFRIKNNETYLMKKYRDTFFAYNLDKCTHEWLSVDIKKSLISDLYRVKIDMDSANLWLEENKKNIDLFQYERNKMAVSQIDEENFFFIWDNYGRFHTNFTTLKKIIRNNYLKLDGEEVGEIDIKNSQPLFLTILLKGEMIDIDEYHLWSTYVFSGTIYENLMNLWNEENIKKIDRADVKILIYRVFFGKNAPDKYNLFFKDNFPNIWKWIKEKKKEMKDTSWLAKELQKMESKFLFGNVITDIKLKNPNIPLFTVHDSIFYPLSFKNTVESIFHKHLSQLEPSLIQINI